MLDSICQGYVRICPEVSVRIGRDFLVFVRRATCSGPPECCRHPAHMAQSRQAPTPKFRSAMESNSCRAAGTPALQPHCPRCRDTVRSRCHPPIQPPPPVVLALKTILEWCRRCRHSRRRHCYHLCRLAVSGGMMAIEILETSNLSSLNHLNPHSLRHQFFFCYLTHNIISVSLCMCIREGE